MELNKHIECADSMEEKGLHTLSYERTVVMANRTVVRKKFRVHMSLILEKLNLQS